MDSYLFESNGPAATSALGRRIGKQIEAGSILALTGELGCGKTLLTRGICAGLDVPLRLVNSPTFMLVNEYPGRLPIFHMDLYRLETDMDAVELGISDYLIRAERGVMIIEWAEKILSVLPDDILQIRFEIVSARQRRIRFLSSTGRYEKLLGKLAKL